MREGWEVKSLGDITQIFTGGTPKTGIEEYWGGNIAWITPSDLGKLKTREVDKTKRRITEKGLEKSSAKLFPKDSVILSTRAPIGHLAINKIDMSTNQGCRGIVPKDNLNTIYLYYFLKSNVELLNDLGKGTTFKELSTKALSSVPIPIPPLPEQKQIVKTLDLAFGQIDQAKANLEQNLANAKELFASKLNEVFSQRGEGWEEDKFSNCIKLKSGSNLTAKKMIMGKIPVYGGNGITGYHNDFNLDGDNIIIGRVGALCGNVRYINEQIWLTDNAFKISEYKYNFDYKFLVYLLNRINLRNYARQSAQPVISNSSIKDVLLKFPVLIEEQKQIVKILDELSLNIKTLQTHYQQNLNNLEELKKSILEKAFKGEL